MPSHASTHSRALAAVVVALSACGGAGAGGANTAADGTPLARFVEVGRGTGEPGEVERLDIASGGDCGGLSLAARSRTSLLAGRVAMALPSADLRGMPHSIMAAEPSREWAEIAWMESDEGRMAIVVSESLRVVEGDLGAAVLPWAPTTATVERASDDLVAAFASVVVQRGDDVRLARVYVRDAQGLVVMVDVITDPDNARRGGCVEFARELAASVTPGARVVDLAPHPVTIDGLSLDVPAGFASTIDHGPDFEVLRLENVIRTDDAPGASLGLYVGDHPSFAPGDTAAVTRELLGASVPFFDRTEEGVHRREALIERGDLGVHVFYSSSDAALFDALDGAAASLRAATP